MLRVWPQWWQVDLVTRYGTWWPWYGQFEVGWIQTLLLWLSAAILWLPRCGFHEVETYAMYSYIPLYLNQLRNEEVDQWLQICIVKIYQWVYILVEDLFYHLVHSFISPKATVACYPPETNTCALITQKPEQVLDITNKRFPGVFTLNCLQQDIKSDKPATSRTGPMCW